MSLSSMPAGIFTRRVLLSSVVPLPLHVPHELAGSVPLPEQALHGICICMKPWLITS